MPISISPSLIVTCLLCLLLPALYLLHTNLTREKRVIPPNVPWVGLPSGWLSVPRAHILEWWRSRQLIKTGYEQYGKAGKAFLTPNRNWQPEVVLAPSQIKWLIDLPESEVSIAKVLIEDVAFHYTSPRAWNFGRPFHIECLNKINLSLITDDMVDEISYRSAEYFSHARGEPKECDLRQFMWLMVMHITNRTFAGKELSSNESYLMWNIFFNWFLLPTSIIINTLVPAVLQPILGPLLSIPCRFCDYKASQYLQVELKKHMAAATSNRESFYDERKSNMLQLMARFAAKSDDPRDWDTHNLASRLLALNFVGIHTSSAAATNAWIDILVSGEDLYQRLRQEATTVLEAAGGKWTKAAVAKLELLDSTLRESLRFSAFKARGLERQVIAKNGVTLPDGTHLPYGTKIGVPTADIQRDENFYAQPDEFIPDRFVGKAEYGMVNTSETFLAFGHGRHACPGRFFSAYELKLLFAHLLLNYDFDYLPQRPKHMWVSDFFVPERVFINSPRRA